MFLTDMSAPETNVFSYNFSDSFYSKKTAADFFDRSSVLLVRTAKSFKKPF